MKSVALRWVAACSLCLLMAVVPGVVSGCRSTTPELNDITAYRAERTAVETEYELPPGFLWSDPPDQESGTMFQKGVGRAEVEDYWIAAWETEWLEQRGVNQQREVRALNILKNEVPKTRVMAEYSDETIRAMYADAIAAAELGDPSGMQEQLELNSGIVLVRGP